MKHGSRAQSPARNPFHRRVSGLLASLLLLGATAPSLADTICFYVDKSGLTGHCFVQLLPMGGPQAGRTDLVYGKYPATWDIFGGPGVIKWDKGRRWDQRICYTVTVAQYNAAASKVSGKITAPPPYNLVSNPPGNCVDWMTAAGTAAALTLPGKTWFGIGDPATFGNSLKAIGNGGTFAGGTVAYNPDTNIGPDGNPVASNPPRDFGAQDMANVAHTDPAMVASATMLALDVQNLGVFPITPQSGLSVNVSNAGPGNALISMNWGDASDVEVQATSFFHVYAVLGTYPASLAVVNSEAVHLYRMLVEVTEADSSGSEVDVFVPTPVPAGGDNPGFEDPPPPEEQVPTAAEQSSWGRLKSIFR